MNTPAQPFPYVSRDPSLGNASLAPMLPLTLIAGRQVTTAGLVDSGAAINRSQQMRSVELSGNLTSVEARGGYRG